MAKDKQHYQGLSASEIEESRSKHGNNLLTPPKKESMWKLFLEKFEDPIIRILLIAAILSLGISILHNEYAETIGIFCAIFLATGVAFWFERDANKKFDVLNQINDEEAVMVMRDGAPHQISKKDIVVGDIVILNVGDEVPADGELLESISLQINESTLTGEPSIDKTTDEAHFEEGVTYPSNWVLRSTKVLNGHGIFVVKRVGDATEFGKVAEKSTEKVETITPLNQQLDKLAKLIGIVGLLLAVLTFSVLFARDILFDSTLILNKRQIALLLAVILGMVVALSKVWVPIIYDGLNLFRKNKSIPKSVTKGGWLLWLLMGVITFATIAGVAYLFGVDPTLNSSWIDVNTAGIILQHFMIAVTLVVVAVPEGLPMSVTLSLALSMRRMLKENNLVRKMHACETMGATTVICTDKTGTLTQNLMQVNRTVFYGMDNQKFGENEVSQLIAEGISLNSTAYLEHKDGIAKPEVLGNPTEGALLLWLEENKIDFTDLRDKTEILDQLPFSTEHKYMGTVVESSFDQRNIIYIKGAPEIILAKCNYMHTADGVQSISADDTAQIEAVLLEDQNKAMRTLGFAYKYVAEGSTSEIPDLVACEMIFLGFASISDPVRSDVPDAVSQCLHAGIGVKIVTGDTFGIAKEIGRQIGIWNPDTDGDKNIISGPDFEALSDEEAFARVRELKIMCRARPTDKQRLVQLLKKSGEVVAVTGDGTNDAPALNYADVGLSMGSGTSVAKEASDITLLDDSFSSIATAVMWGRSLYQNIQRFILFQLTINVTALLIVFLGSILGHELPLTVTQMLWVNLIMDTFAAGALASLPPNPKVMNKKPRSSKDFIITPSIGSRIIGMGILFVILLLGMMFYFADSTHLNETFGYIIAEDRERYFLSYFFTVFVLLQFWNLFNAKAYATGQSALANLGQSSGFLIVAVLILAGQFLIVTFGGDVFRTMPLLGKDWATIIGGTSIVFVAGEIVRFVRKKHDD